MKLPWKIINENMINISKIMNDLLDTVNQKDIKWLVKDSGGAIVQVNVPNMAKINEEIRLINENYIKDNVYIKSVSDDRFVHKHGDSITGDYVIDGDLEVKNIVVTGQTTTVESQTVTVKDKNIELGNVDTPTDDTADGGGITIKGTTDKTIIWEKITNSWKFSHNIIGNIATASKWLTARKISLGGDASGSVTIDGTSDETLTVTVKNDSHTHDGRYYTESESNTRFAYKHGTDTQNFNGDVFTGNAFTFRPGQSANDDGGIEWLGGDNSGFMRFYTSDDNGTEYVQFGDYDSVNRGGVFTEWLKMYRNYFKFTGNIYVENGNFHGNLVGTADKALWSNEVNVRSSDAGSGDFALTWHAGVDLYRSSFFTINRDKKKLSSINAKVSNNLELGTNSEATIKYNGADNSIDFIIN